MFINTHTHIHTYTYINTHTFTPPPHTHLRLELKEHIKDGTKSQFYERDTLKSRVQVAYTAHRGNSRNFELILWIYSPVGFVLKQRVMAGRMTWSEYNLIQGEH